MLTDFRTSQREKAIQKRIAYLEQLREDFGQNWDEEQKACHERDLEAQRKLLREVYSQADRDRGPSAARPTPRPRVPSYQPWGPMWTSETVTATSDPISLPSDEQLALWESSAKAELQAEPTNEQANRVLLLIDSLRSMKKAMDDIGVRFMEAPKATKEAPTEEPTPEPTESAE